MISFGAIIYYRYLKQRHKEAVAEEEAATKAALKAQAKSKGKNKKR
jgi:hypothetical protein